MPQPLSEDHLVSPFDDKGFSSSTDPGASHLGQDSSSSTFSRSSSVRSRNKSDIMTKIEKDLDEINVDIGLDDLLKHIAQLLDLIDNGKLARQKARTRQSWH